MTGLCGEGHPALDGVECRMPPGPHPHHMGRGEVWPNQSYEGPSTAGELRRLRKTKPKSKMAHILTAGRAATTKAEGMDGSFASIKDDPHNWPIVQECIRAAARAYPQVSTNEVWDLLLAREDYTYGGDRGYMGSILSHWGRKQGLVGEAIGTVPNRMPWAHSGLGVNLYPSLIYKSPGD